jgi:parallel beta-helix repeat protein
MRISSQPRRRGLSLASLLLLVIPTLAQAKVWTIRASQNVEFDAEDALIQAQPGDTVELPAGRFQMRGELTINTPYITLKGQGMDKTILVYGPDAVSTQGIYAAADHTTIEDLSVVDQPGDGIKIIGANGATIRRTKVEWTKKGSVDNGSYGIYPVQCSNVLLEDNIVIGASDAGIYVGQSHNIIVRNNRAEYNVAGIEIENSQNADVYNNFVTNNAGGLLVFNLPNLLVQGGRGTRLFHNVVYANNFENFAPPGNTVATVPQGTGVLVMSNDEVEIFSNTIDSHNTTSIAVVSYLITEPVALDPNFDAMPESIYIHDNTLRNSGKDPLKGGNKLGLVAAALSFPNPIPHITYDGIGKLGRDGKPTEAVLNGDKRLCIQNNDQDGGDKSYFGNMNLWTKAWWSPIPGKMDLNLEPHNCSGTALPAIVLAEVPPAPAPVVLHSEEEVAALCSASVKGVNWDALEVDCPDLSSYNLFKNPSDALSAPNEGGHSYDLNTPLFSDYASKDRTIFLPAGKQMNYRSDKAFDIPVGAVIAKTFYFPENINAPTGPRKVAETRLLIHRADGWKGLVYVWDGEKAQLKRGGAKVDTAWIDANGQPVSNAYRVPNMAQCTGCHTKGEPIGVKAGYLNRKGHGDFAAQNQLQALSNAGALTGLPSDETTVPKFATWNDPNSGSLSDRAKAYLDINCAHCHSVVGKASTSGLYLNLGRPEDVNFGFCKPPVAAGRGAGATRFDIVPGKPEESILVHRLASTKAAVKMPELAKGLVHAEGVELISAWIQSLPGECKN